jgi:hypothetical protein
MIFIASRQNVLQKNVWSYNLRYRKSLKIHNICYCLSHIVKVTKATRCSFRFLATVQYNLANTFIPEIFILFTFVHHNPQTNCLEYYIYINVHMPCPVYSPQSGRKVTFLGLLRWLNIFLNMCEPENTPPKDYRINSLLAFLYVR